jgi:signal transduction histidine kinase
MTKFDQLVNDIKENNALVLDFLKKVDLIISQSGNVQLTRLLQKENRSIVRNIESLEKKSDDFHTDFGVELDKRTLRLKKRIEDLQRAKESAISDNILLEYKKKDLQQLAADLEEAYEEISKQSKELKSAHQQILEKNQEMVQQREMLLDQTDYLHESNETITKMHEEVQRQKEELLVLNNEKNNLIGIVAHDLKSPLNQIKGLITLIKMTPQSLDEETLGYIGMIEQSAGRLSNMIAKILDVEAIESKSINLTIEKINLSDMVHIIHERFRQEAEQKNITLHNAIEKDVVAEVDRSYVDQVFQNLFSNAIKFSPPNKKIFINLGVRGEKTVFEIKDEGPGLTADDKKMLFGKYQKLSAKPTGNETSTGLGLSIVKKFVESMKGEIWCESEPGNGASFFVAFTAIS